MPFAVIRAGDKQFRVEENQTLRLPKLGKGVGETVEFDVLMMGGDNGVEVGAPSVSGARVTRTIVEHGRAEKIIVFKKKRRKQYKRKQGHRQDFTAVKINSIG